jgi:peptidoglycan/LPS O-acetylase OafA/YrhL
MTDPGAARPSLLPYWPALDGLRALAVVGVLCFHSGFSWATGGYLGVSTFFTLSGFLITSLLLAERDGTGAVNPRAFWSRRFRRLLPAALCALALAVLYGVTVADASQVRALRADVLASLSYVANWRFVFDQQAYADIFGAPSPVLHFWSLAIEEQFYVIFPLAAMGLLAAAGGRRHLLVGVLGAATALSVGLALFAGFDQNRIYLGTDTRAAELLAGALLATWVTGRRRRLTHPQRVLLALAGPLALAGIVWAMIAVPQTTPGLYRGGLAIFALASTTVVLSALQPHGLVANLLSWRPAVELGRISYGVYLYHWPVFLWLSPERTGLDGGASQEAALFVVRVGVTLAMSIASFALIEQPVRTGRLLAGRRALAAAPAAAGVVAVLVVLATLAPPRPLIDFAEAERSVARLKATATATATATNTPNTPTTPTGERDLWHALGADDVDVAALPMPPPPRFAVFGDSTALMTTMGLNAWAEDTGLATPVPGGSWLGCGLGRGGDRRIHPGQVGPVPELCARWAPEWGTTATASQPDLAIVQIGPWEIVDRRLVGDDTWRAFGDPVYDDYFRDEMLEATDLLAAGGATVVWLTSPAVGPGEAGDEIERRGVAADPRRMARLNELMIEVVALRPGVAHVIDLADFLAGTGEDVRLRPDGVHFSEETATEVAARWLGPTLVELHRQLWIEGQVGAHSPADVAEDVRRAWVASALADLEDRVAADGDWHADSLLLASRTQGD